MRLLNSIRQHAASMDAGAAVAKWGIVTASDVNRGVRVRLQPEDVQTDWLPLASSMVGGGWGLVHVPPAGTPVLCLPESGDATNLIVIGSTWSASNRPPQNVAAGEFWLVHSTGSKIALTNDGKVTISDAGGCSLVFGNNGTATLTGNLLVTGNVTDVNGAHGSVADLRTAYDAHKHGGGATTDHPV